MNIAIEKARKMPLTEVKKRICAARVELDVDQVSRVRASTKKGKKK